MASLEKVFRSIRFAGLPNVLLALRYARFKSRLDRLHPSHQLVSLPACSPGLLLDAQNLPGGGTFQFERSDLEILFLAPDLARISWSPGIPPLPYALARSEWSIPETVQSQQGDEWVIESSALQVRVCPNGSLFFQDHERNLLYHQFPPTSRSQPEEGTAAIKNFAAIKDIAWTGISILQPGECLVGMGEHSGHLNLVGGDGYIATHRLWNSSPGGKYGPGQDPLYAPIPVYLGLHPRGSYLVFYENPFPGVFQAGPGRLNTEGEVEFQPEDGPEETGVASFSQVSFEGGQLRYYFIPGSPERAIERYTELTGRPGLPPRWSLGYHQSRWGYKTEEDVRSVVAGFQQHDLPLSAIHLDIDYMDGCRVFSISQGRYPDLGRLSRDLHDQGIKLVTILDPGVKVDPGYGLYREGLEAGVFCSLPGGRPLVGLVWPGNTVFPDFTHPQVREWWGEQYSSLLAAGVDGFWHDMNEPEAFSASEDMTLPLATCHYLEGRGGDHHQAHNLYGLLMNRAGYEGLLHHRPEKRPWIISRAGWAGSSRYAWNWTGDIESTWEGLRLTIAMILNLGLSGQPFSGVDIGGFSGDPEAELYLRWFQAAAFLPFFRTHSALGTARREPWVYGEPYTSRIRKALQFRYRLLPYLYTLAHEAAETGHPLARPLLWMNPSDVRLQQVEDAFLLGDALLVAPIMEPGMVTRSLALPGGAWYDLWEDRLLPDADSVTLTACLDRIPVLVRAGTVLPLEENGNLSLHIYPLKKPGRFTNRLYLDAGDGKPYTADPQAASDWREDRLVVEQTDGCLEIAWETTGSYPFPYPAIQMYLHGRTTRRAFVDGEEIPLQYGPLMTRGFQHLHYEVSLR